MNIREKSSQFLVYVLSPNADVGAAIKVSLAAAGYEAYYFHDGRELEARLSQSPPHILIFSTEGLQGQVDAFFERAKSFYSDLAFILLAEGDAFSELGVYNQFGLEEIINIHTSRYVENAVWSVDRICEKLYYRFQNEQIYDSMLKYKTAAEQNELAIPVNQNDLNVLNSNGGSLSALMLPYSSGQSKEDFIQVFLYQNTFALAYLKYLPMVGSFVLTQSSGFALEKIQGLGIHVDKPEHKKIVEEITLENIPSSILKVVQQQLGISEVLIKPVFDCKELDGFFLFAKDISVYQKQSFDEKFNLFNLHFNQICLQKKMTSLESKDFVTDLYNVNNYAKILAKEFEQARQGLKPISLVKICIDDFTEIEQSLGAAVRDQILKSLSNLITKTSRPQDISCRNQLNEFSLILPQTTRKGASIRAERLRRLVETASLSENGIRITISLGISEYPSVCSSLDALEKTATQAMVHISEKGGNRLCLFKATEKHLPEFQVNDEAYAKD